MSDENPTLPYPDASAEHSTLVLPSDRGAEPRQHRRRWPWVLLVVLLVPAALVVAAELLARSIVPGIVRGIVVEQLDLPADQQLDVETTGILLPQLIGGRLDELHLASDSITLGGITGRADVTAVGVPLSGGDFASAHATVRIGEDQFAALLETSDLPIDAVELDEPHATASGSVSVLGITVPIALTLTPAADHGELLLTPVSLEVAGMNLDAEQIADRLGDLGEQLTRPHRVCIADRFPAGVIIDSVEVSGDEVVVGADVDGGIVSEAGLQVNGACP